MEQIESKTKLYAIWRSMRERCHNKNHKYYKHYGGRGIKVCKEWDNYNNFKTWALKSGYKSNLTIDRYPNYNGNYTPKNCRWATRKEQANNRTNNVLIHCDGKIKTISQWAQLTGIAASTISYRYKKGFRTKEKLFATPIHQPKYYTYKGKSHTLKEWAEILNVDKKFLESRIQKGWSIEKTLTKKNSKELNKIFYNGQFKNMTEWAALFNIKRRTLNKRLNNGWPIEKALNQSVL